MADVPIARSDYFRGVAKEARLMTRNRYFEENPALTDQQAALLARMGLRRLKYVGEGPIRAVYSQPGSFSGALFTVSGNNVYRIDPDLTETLIGAIDTSDPRSFVSMAATSNIGTTPAFLFVAGGSALMCYIENGYASGEITGTPANNDTVTIDTTVYKFTTGDVDAGDPDGSLASPWLVALGGTPAQATATFSGLPVANQTITIGGQVFTFKASATVAFEVTIGTDAATCAQNLRDAINEDSTIATATANVGIVTMTTKVRGTAANATTLSETASNLTISGATFTGAANGTASDAWTNLGNAIDASGMAGTDYSSDLTANEDVTIRSIAASGVIVHARDAGTIGNSIATTETGAAIAWASGTLSGGGSPEWFQVDTPDDVGVISLGYIASHVVVIPAQGNDINGRFFWIEPGETTIDPLNFATAERAPDPVLQVVVFGDQFWLPGTNTTEAWFFSGDADAPVQRNQGVVFDRGVWEGTAVQIKDAMFTVDATGRVTRTSGGVETISRPDIEERIRAAIQYQAMQEIL